MSQSVIVQEWEESERGWGVRPDGFTVHLSMDDCRQYRREYMQRQYERYGPQVPDEYTRPCGNPFPAKIDLESLELLELESKPEDQGGSSAVGLWGNGRTACSSVKEGKQVSVTALKVLVSPKVKKARESVNNDFSGVLRKVPKGSDITPKAYSTHLHEVARILAYHQYSEDVIVAGYLHDHLEDLPEQWNKAKLEQEFGEWVAVLVDYVTQQDKSLDWETRNALYNERLKAAPKEAMAVSIADKIHNTESLNAYLRMGYKVEDVLCRGWQANSEKLHELRQIYQNKVPNQLLKKFSHALETLDRLAQL